jgi:hypothetical protein
VRRLARLAVLGAALGAVAPPAAGAASPETAVAAPGPACSGREGCTRVALPRLAADVAVDGVLDEPAWEQAARLAGFSQYAPADGRAAEQSTEVRVFYSPTAIHFGVRAQAAPGTVRASLANRDHIGSEDAVQFFLLPYNDARQALYFAVNPLGVQADGTLVEGLSSSAGSFGGLSSGREEPDLAPDFVFESKGRLTDDGYEVELRIPFKSLRFQAETRQEWGLHVLRRSRASGYEDSWVAARRAASSFLGQAGALEGLTDLERGRVLELIPVATARLDGAPRPDGRWRYDGEPEVGANVRWGVSSNLTLNGTANPDFSQVEADAGQFVFDPRNALFFPEKRPFFLDGLEQFATPNRLIYTRRVGAPLAAAKLTGKLSGTTLAFLSAVDGREQSRGGAERPLFNLLRVQRDLAGTSKLGFVYTDRIDGPDSNRVAAADARLAFGKVWSVQLQGALSRTRRDGATRAAPLWEAQVGRNGRRFGLSYTFTGIHDDFRAESGFIGRGGIARGILDHRVTFYGGQGAFLESWSSDVVLDGLWRYPRLRPREGTLERKLHFNNNVVLRGGWKAGLSLLVERFDYDEQLYADYAVAASDGRLLPFLGTPFLRNLDWVITLDTPRFQGFSASLFYVFGRDENFFEWSSADAQYLDLVFDWRPTEQLRVEGEYQFQKFDRRSDGSTVAVRHIPRLKLEYQLSRAVFLRLVGEYDARRQDTLRDDSRTGLPLAIREADGSYVPAAGFDSNRLRIEALFSYQPTPGTVIFAGYTSRLVEPRRFRLDELRRESDGFFVKLSYLFGL